MIKDVINRIISSYSINDNAGIELYSEILQRLGFKPVSVYSPNGAVDDYYNTNGKIFNVSYFGNGGVVIASYLQGPLSFHGN